MVSVQRHQLVRVTKAGWNAILQRSWDAQARECLSYWSMHELPLVVTRQSLDAADGATISLGLPCPARWGRRRLALQVRVVDVLHTDPFPLLEQVQRTLASLAASPALALNEAIRSCSASAHVFGSYGWEAVSGLAYVRPESDLDLWITVASVEQADAVADALRSTRGAGPRLDGELVFADGASVAWREWIEWRSGRARAVLVKRLRGVALERSAAWCGHAAHPHTEALA